MVSKRSFLYNYVDEILHQKSAAHSGVQKTFETVSDVLCILNNIIKLYGYVDH